MALVGNTVEERVWNYLLGKIGNEYGVAGLMGNIYAESGMIFNRVEILCLKRLKENGIKDANNKDYTDKTYTKEVDNGRITRASFMNPLPNKQYGYGICQWTSPNRKSGLYDLAKSKGKSIANESIQLQFLVSELKNTYKTVWTALKNAKSVKQASDIVLTKFEIPADVSSAIKNQRAKYGESYYAKFAKKKTSSTSSTTSNTTTKTEQQKVIEKALSYVGVKEYPPNSNNVIFNTDYYGGAVNDPNLAWCCAYVWDIFRMVGLSHLFYDGMKTAYCPTVLSWAQSKGLTVNKSNAKYGDIVLFDWNNDGIADHIGFIIEYKNGVYYTVEGNTSTGNNSNGGEVMRRERYASDIIAIVRPKYSTTNSATTVTNTQSNSAPMPTNVKWKGTVCDADDGLNVRTWAGVEFSQCSFSPLANGEVVGVCDTVKDSLGADWYYIYYEGKYGFVHGDYVRK